MLNDYKHGLSMIYLLLQVTLTMVTTQWLTKVPTNTQRSREPS